MLQGQIGPEQQFSSLQEEPEEPVAWAGAAAEAVVAAGAAEVAGAGAGV